MKIAGGYLIFGLLWIGTTDRLVVGLVESVRVSTQLQTVKGWIFVGISSVFILGMTRVYQDQMTESRNKLQAANQEIQVLHRVFRHNIRNDINVIIGYTDQVSKQLQDSSSEVHERLGVVRRRAEQIAKLSEKLKVIDAVDPELKPDATVELISIIEDQVEEIESTYPSVTIRAISPQGIRIQSDESVQYAIREVLENAAIHHPSIEDCEITISVEYSGSTVRLEITDNGPGIPADEIETLRVIEETPLRHKSGIGLWLVLWLGRFNEYEVEFSADDDNGTTVTFQFQAEPSFTSAILEPFPGSSPS